MTSQKIPGFDVGKRFVRVEGHLRGITSGKPVPVKVDGYVVKQITNAYDTQLNCKIVIHTCYPIRVASVNIDAIWSRMLETMPALPFGIELLCTQIEVIGPDLGTPLVHFETER